MITGFYGPYDYLENVITNWQYTLRGVYYCGRVINGLVEHLYIGRSLSENGIRGRLLDHLREDDWVDVKYFWYRECSTDQEAINLEATEIKIHQPKYNKQGKKKILFSRR